jgi:TonB-linked SusC/RagA family outer membrane protein
MLRAVRSAFLALFAIAAVATNAWAQAGSIQGTVLDATTARPLSGVQVAVEGTQLAMLTNEQGRFLIMNVPAARYTVRFETLGYGTERVTVTVEAGRPSTANVRLAATALTLDQIVVTGVAGATERSKLAFTVDKLTPGDLPVPATNAGSMIQGKVAGAQVVQGSGRPGSAPSILLRGPKSINATGRSQEPLYIIDGVILGSNIADIPATDIESIEIVKGPAAASLYGSRAANGVIQITTKRGSFTGADRIRYTARTEYGRSALAGTIGIAQNHRYLMNPGQTAFLAASDTCTAAQIRAGTCQGREFQWLQGGNDFAQRAQPVTMGNPWTEFQDKPWPGGTYDHVARFFDPGDFNINYLGVEGRSGGTRYHLSLNNSNEAGVLYNQPGRRANSARINLDQGVMDNLQVSANTFFSRSSEGLIGTGGAGGAFFTLTRMPAGVDLTARDADGNLIVRPDQTGENANPLIELEQRQLRGERERFIGGATLRYTPLHWFDIDGNVSYDRTAFNQSDYFPKGYQTARPSQINQGFVDEYSDRTEAMNASITTSLRHSFNENIHNRTQLRWLTEQQDFRYTRGWGYNLAAADIPTLFNTRDARTPRSAQTRVNSEGFFAITNFDIHDRYVVDALVRRDGSSLFGENERWQTYYRGAAAWLISREAFWVGLQDALPQVKLHYSYGTAGGRPAFAAQYETYNVGDAGQLTPVALGNRNLKPEFAIEQEMGISMNLLGRASLDLVYAMSEVRDQILRVPLAGYTGFREQWQNAGTLQSNTFEAAMDIPWLRRENVSFSSRLLYDRTRQEITEMYVPAYQYGFPAQGLDAVFYARTGERVGTFYGNRWATSCGDLPSLAQGTCATEWQVNDDGYLVWVGNSNTWMDGISKNLWGTRGPAVRGSAVYWGTPVLAQDADGEIFMPLGNTTPDYSMSVANTLNFGNFTVYGLLDAVQGFQVYNLPRQWAYFENYHADQDQGGKADTHKKPAGYYGSTGLYARLSPPNSHFVEDGSFVKLREVSMRYRFNRDQLGRVGMLQGLDGVGISVIGRNLHTWTKYRGYDPEVGFGGGATGSAAIARFDGFQYPNFRTITAAIELNF